MMPMHKWFGHKGCKIVIRAFHNFAIARELPNSFDKALSQHYSQDQDESHHNSLENIESSGVDMEKCKRQHKQYISDLRSIVPVLSLPAEEDHPDCCFVEDTVIAIGNRALITSPGHESRRGEVKTVRTVLEQLGLEIVDMEEQSASRGLLPAHCDGGDVLYTGRHLFVGVSERTNEEAVEIIEDVFPDIPLIPVAQGVQGKHALHLKSAVTHLDETTLLAPAHPMGYKLLRAMRAHELGYQAVRLPNVLACNAVSVNGTALVQDTACSTSRELLETAAAKQKLDLKFVDSSELAKKDAALTCCSVLLRL